MAGRLGSGQQRNFCFIPGRENRFLSSQSVQTNFGTHQATCAVVMVVVVVGALLLQWVESPESEVDHSAPSRAKVKVE